MTGTNQIRTRRWTVRVYDASGDLVDTVQGVAAPTRKIAKRKVQHGSWKPWMAPLRATLVQRGFKMTATPERVTIERHHE